VLRDQRDGRNAGELAYQVGYAVHLLRPTPVYRYENGIHRSLANYAHCLRDRVAVHQRKTAAAGGVHPGSLNRQQDRRNGRRAPLL
jgi:hypothetical protein